jgi:hypothetical protein
VRGVWPPAVVVLYVDAQDVFELTAADDQQPIETRAADVPTQRSMWAFAFGARTGARMILTPSFPRSASKAAESLASRS